MGDSEVQEEEVKAIVPNTKAITVFLSEDGKISVDPIGFSLFEIPTVLRRAARLIEEKIGI